MAESTISIKPFAQEYKDSDIRQAFKEFDLKRIHINRGKEEAFVEFANPSDVEALSGFYEDCTVPSLGNANIGFVDSDFSWPKESQSNEKPAQEAKHE